jgi:MarR-like DNA-binding transcriptional regulator SgrR of sgrS sRNA
MSERGRIYELERWLKADKYSNNSFAASKDLLTLWQTSERQAKALIRKMKKAGIVTVQTIKHLITGEF